MLVLWLFVCASRVVVMRRGGGHLAVCISTLVSRVDGWRQKCKARPRREHVSCVSIVTKRQKSTIVSGMRDGGRGSGRGHERGSGSGRGSGSSRGSRRAWDNGGSWQREPAVAKYYD